HLQEEDVPVQLSEWLESALRARGVVGYRQDVTNLPSLGEILNQNEESRPSLPAIPNIEDHSPEKIEIVDAGEPAIEETEEEKKC
ncbi:MAG: hypothetical protein KC931_17940, partial [Candidatus Omnitrophica bacterium]|nr:hypothetical protein [Candidatus Omnitrophota bacterium]